LPSRQNATTNCSSDPLFLRLVGGLVGLLVGAVSGMLVVLGLMLVSG